jgi:hypothetical protein
MDQRRCGTHAPFLFPYATSLIYGTAARKIEVFRVPHDPERDAPIIGLQRRLSDHPSAQLPISVCRKLGTARSPDSEGFSPLFIAYPPPHSGWAGSTWNIEPRGTRSRTRRGPGIRPSGLADKRERKTEPDENVRGKALHHCPFLLQRRRKFYTRSGRGPNMNASTAESPTPAQMPASPQRRCGVSDQGGVTSQGIGGGTGPCRSGSQHRSIHPRSNRLMRSRTER